MTRTCHNRCGVSVCKEHSAALSAEAPNDSDTCYRELRRFSVEQYLFILLYITYCDANFNALDTSINMSHSSVANGVTMNLMCKIGME